MTLQYLSLIYKIAYIDMALKLEADRIKGGESR